MTMDVTQVSGNSTRNPKFIAPKQELKTKVDSIFTEQRKRVENAYRKAMLAYSTDTYQDKREEYVQHINKRLMQEYPETTVFELIGIKRYLLPTSKAIFEDDKGNLLTTKKVTSAITAKIKVSVMDPRTTKHGQGNPIQIQDNASVYTYSVGHFAAPIPKFTWDNKNDQIIDSNVDHFENRFYIKDSPEQIRKLISKFGEPLHGITVAIANVTGPTCNQTFTVPNIREAIETDIPTLIGANQRGMLSVQEGGVQAYRKWKGLENNLISAGQATEQQLSKISKEDILNILQQKEDIKK